MPGAWPGSGSGPPPSACGLPRCCWLPRSTCSAEQILATLRAAGARVSKATVYNTLNLFAERGVIRQLSVDGARTWFDSNVAPHYHFHDLDTGALMDRAGARGGIRAPARAAGRHGNGGY